ncbi:TPR repeat protein [Desulforapulum autotrophicum HRM2]|uniref:TPR repeat protein n=1 Tax=Desulforapulum autotrophicum (strain ATCC 43914 / DSM 3382 / VKM B-1955 / HRM2) TaxID=177437 RepID=C0QD88_DESAH|nr:tetratricopeptide repeat protein [Desulforapulum autotrophicum]ACN13126.1 TPR repeat protein [Desulforapulum autotrophicum HRM2]
MDKRTLLLLVFIIFLQPQLTLGKDNIQADIPFSTAIALEKARNMTQADKRSQAIDLLETFRKKLIETNKQIHPFLLFTLGNYSMEANHIEEATRYYEDCVKNGGDFSPAWLNLAKACYDLEQFNRAGQCFVRGYELETEKRAVLLYYAANAFFSARQYPKAMAVFNRLTKNHTGEIQPSWHELAVHIFLALEQPKNALPHMEYLAQNMDGTARTTWQEALLYQYMELGMDKKALDFVTFLTREYPLEPKWWKGLARFSLDNNKMENAIVAMTLYSFLTPLTDNEKKLMADLYLAAGIPAKAVEHYQDISTPEKRLAVTQNTVIALRQMNLDQKALELLDQVLTTEKISIKLKMLKGDLLFYLEQYQAAETLFETLAPKDNSGHSWLMLGYSRWNLGKIQSARTAMARAATFKQQKKAAARAIKSLK